MWEIEKIVSKGAYNYAVVKSHPKASKRGYVLEHRIVMENALGRLLMDNEVVHHRDENKKNNHPDNLEVMTITEHGKHHAQQPIYLLCVCAQCGTAFQRRANQRPSVKGTKNTFCSRSCNGKFQRSQQLSK